MNIKELRDAQEKILSEARERLDLIGKETDEARAKELETAHDKAMAEFDRIGKQIEREENLEALEKRAAEIRAKQRPGQPDDDARGQDLPELASYRTAFYKMLASGGDVSELTAEERTVLRSGVQKAEFRAQSVGTNSAGGYTVPVELANEIVVAMKAHGPMYDPGVTTEMTTAGGNQINIPTVDDTSKSGAAHTENTALTDDGSEDVTFGQKRLDAYAFDTEFIRWSWELSQDSIFNIESLLGRLLGERLGRLANTQLTTGTGSSAPNGIVTASSAGVTAASATAITADEIINLIHSVDPAYRIAPKVAFMFNDSTLSAIRKLKDGQGNYLWQMGNVQQGVPGSLLGYRYYINQAIDSIAASKKVALFGDLSYYYVRKVGAPVIGVMRERFWPDLGIAGLIRFDGELTNTAAVKHLITAAS